MSDQQEPDQRNLEAIESASKNRINEIFAMDPTALTDADVDALISELRRVRHIFSTEDRAAKAQGRKVKPSKGVRKEKMPEELLDLQIEGLDEIIRKEFSDE